MPPKEFKSMEISKNLSKAPYYFKKRDIIIREGVHDNLNYVLITHEGSTKLHMDLGEKVKT